MSGLYRIALHGGAGVNPERNYAEVESHLSDLVARCETMLKGGAAAIDVVEIAVIDMENSGLYVAGRGSAPNMSGQVECDASIMDGYRNRAGGVCALNDIENPICAARAVLEKTPFMLLAGSGAKTFALQHGCIEVEDPANYYRLPVGVEKHELTTPDLTLSHGTVGAVALDRNGHLASATSTGGLFGTLAGRVGDTPIAGIGTWADEDVAISCTGIGEAFMSAGGARDIVARMRYGGETLGAGITDMLDNVGSHGGDGGVIAIDRQGNVEMTFNSSGMKRASAGSNLSPMIAIL